MRHENIVETATELLHLPRKAPCRGWSLLELLTVVAIVGIALALILPALGRARGAVRRAVCQSHLRNLGLATQQYVAARQRFPPAASQRRGEPRQGRSVPPRHSVITHLLPFFERASLYRQLDLRRDWNDPVNDARTRQHLGGILVCPAAPGNRRRYHVSDYNPAIRVDPSERTGLGALLRSGRVRNRSQRAGPEWGSGEPVWDNVLQLDQVDYQHRIFDRRIVRPRDVRDGFSRTILLVENAGKPICYRQGQRADCKITRFRWASPNLWMTINDVCGQDQLVNCSNNSQPYSFHTGGVNVAYADGSVRFLSQQTDPDVFVSFITLAAGD
jgi:prepilin-type N-terminal cleavage/methylation domain-containing protein/prepilin-type processing-associated H-X9-DG protein